MKGKFYLLFLSLLSAALLSLSWYWQFTICIFFAFVPLLIIEDKITSSGGPKTRLKLLGYSYLTFVTWNVLVTWWVVFASAGGASLAFLANSFLMAAVFVIFSVLKNRVNKPWSIWLLIPLWIAWEHGHTLWDLSWTWLTLGNVFAFNTNWIQWYEYTGTSGGTLWALAVNIVVFGVLKNKSVTRYYLRSAFKIAGIVVLPIALSYWILIAYTLKEVQMAHPEKKEVLKVLVVQPNIDPYNVKFTLDYQSQFFKMLDLVRGRITEETRYLVLPETFITDDINEGHLSADQSVQWFRDSLISRFPQLMVVTGGNTYVFFEDDNDRTATSRKDERSGKYYDMFNSAMFIDKTTVQVYHKSKLVPGVERMPFPALLAPLEGLAIDMGGTVGSLGTQDKRSVFRDSLHTAVIAPVVCYESIYADYVAEYVRNGAGFIFIITNDGWWQDTPGYIQHLNYGRLRAIENRRQIARSANTGVSCFIDEFGKVSDPTKWWEEAVIEKNLTPNYELTFFSRFGDLLSYSSTILSILLILWPLFLSIKRKFLPAML